ncbi:MAG: alpha/beta fold hydrolase [Legionella sp.]
MSLTITEFGRGIKPLVFFHGWGFSSKIWLPLIPNIIGQYKIFLVDLPGFGTSSKMDWQTFKLLLLQDLPKQFSLVGWSMGGLLATRLAIEEPERVSALVNIASSPKFIQDQDWPGIKKTMLNLFYRKLIHYPHQTLEKFINLQTAGHFDAYELVDSIPSLPALKVGLEYLVEYDLRSQLSQLSSRCCYLFGRLDSIVPIATLAVMKKNYPQFHYMAFDKSGHAPFLAEQAFFVAVLEEVLQ